MRNDLRDVIHSLSREVELDNTSEILIWFVENVCNQKGFWKWPDLYFISQESQMKWWRDTAEILMYDADNTISYNTRRYLYKDLKKWLLHSAKLNAHEW